MKYRRLQREELEAVRDEFVQFLAANSVTADDWQRLMADDQHKAHALIDLFSDIFWEKALSRVNYLAARGAFVLRAYRADETQLHLIQLEVPQNGHFRFDQDADMGRLAQGEETLISIQAQVTTGSKNVGEDRHQELFKLLESGAIPDHNRLYDSLSLYLQQTH